MKSSRVRKDYNISELSLALKNIAAEIRSFREMEKISQSERAKRASVSKTTINDLENGKATDIQLSTLLLIAETIQQSPTSLIQRTDLEDSSSDRSRFIESFESLQKGLKGFEILYRKTK